MVISAVHDEGRGITPGHAPVSVTVTANAREGSQGPAGAASTAGPPSAPPGDAGAPAATSTTPSPAGTPCAQLNINIAVVTRVGLRMCRQAGHSVGSTHLSVRCRT